MIPGIKASPPASTVSRPAPTSSPIALMTPPSTARLARNGRPPVPLRVIWGGGAMDPGHKAGPACVDRLPARPDIVADRADDAAVDGEAGAERAPARPVEDQGVANDQIVHVHLPGSYRASTRVA